MERVYAMGVLGLGEGRSVLSAVGTSTRWRLAAVCDLNAALVERRLEEFSLPASVVRETYEAMLADPSVEVVGIYTPDPLHGRHIRMALQAGKHVVCTKPVLTDLAEADDLLRLSREKGLHVFVGQSSRFFGPMMRQRQDFEEGRLGELCAVEAFYKTDARWFLEKGWSLGKGFSWLYNFMIHAVDLACWYLPDVTEVYAVSHLGANTKAYGLDIPDTIKCLFRDADGRIAQVEGAYAAPTLGHAVEPSISCTLRGTDGTCRAEYPNLVYHTHFAGDAPISHDLSDLWDYYFRFEGQSHHAGEYQNYLEAVARGLDAGMPAKPDLREAVRILRVVEAVEECLRTGTPVPVGKR